MLDVFRTDTSLRLGAGLIVGNTGHLLEQGTRSVLKGKTEDKAGGGLIIR